MSGGEIATPHPLTPIPLWVKIKTIHTIHRLCFVTWVCEHCQFVLAACWHKQVYFLIYFTRLLPKERSLCFALILLKSPVLFGWSLERNTAGKPTALKNPAHSPEFHTSWSSCSSVRLLCGGIKPSCQCCRLEFTAH